MGMMSKMLGQCRKPTGWLGRMVARGMNFSHAEMTDWGLGQISIGKSDTILDVGCGGGGTIRIRILSAIPVWHVRPGHGR